MRSERKNNLGISSHPFGIQRRDGRIDSLCANRFKCHWLDEPNVAGRVERLGSRYSRGLESGGASGPPFRFSLGEIPWPRASFRAIIRSTSSPTRRRSRCPTAARGAGQRAALLRWLLLGFMARVQHYDGATRLLDMASSLDVAHCFASSRHDEMTGVVYSYRVNPDMRVSIGEQPDGQEPETDRCRGGRPCS